MKPIWAVFCKDGTELLRDRRTLFVNVVLPVLLYPMMLLFLIQVYQLTQAHRPPPPRVVMIDIDAVLVEAVRSGQTTTPEKPADTSDKTASKAGDTQVVVVTPTASPAASEAVAQAHGLGEAIAAAMAARATADGAESPTSERSPAPERAALLQLVRQEWSAAAIVVRLPEKDGQARILIAFDDADPQFERTVAVIDAAVEYWRQDLIEQRLQAHQVPLTALHPAEITRVGLAPKAQATRMRLAGIIPILLVIMALSGAFYPALDLIAGERERGTLETLLTWPVRRRDIFLGKLLVTVCAGLLAVILNLLSLGFTMGLAGNQLAGSGGGGMDGLLAVGAGTLALSFLALLPLVVTLSAISLALAGFAASSKEAQNYLSPLFLVVMLAAAVALVPDARPTFALDLIPITGPVLALKEALRASEIPWLHLLLSTAGSIALAAVVVAWSVRLLDQESFCYPGLVRAGWGRWRRWGAQPSAPGGLEALGLFAACAAAFMLIGPSLARFGVVAQIAGPLILCLALPVLLHAWAGRYPAAGLHLGGTRGESLLRATLMIPCALALSLALSTLQPAPPPDDAQTHELMRILTSVQDLGGLPLLLLVIAVAPGICEEMLCRGTLLAGLRRGLGTTGAVLVSSFCFAALHLSPYRFVPQFSLGIFLALLTLRSGSIWPAVLVHIGHNGLAVLLSGEGDDSEGLPIQTLTAVTLAVVAAIGLFILARPRPSVALHAPGHIPRLP